MGRLTEKNTIAVCGSCSSWGVCKPTDKCFIKEVYAKLKRLEDLEEAGRLIELPCKVDDTVWALDTLLGYVGSFEVTSISITDSGVAFENVYECCFVNLEKFGETWFLTKAEAEAKLAELKGGVGDE